MPGDQVGPAYGEAAGQHPAEAVPDDLHPRAAALRDRLEPRLELRRRREVQPTLAWMCER